MKGYFEMIKEQVVVGRIEFMQHNPAAELVNQACYYNSEIHLQIDNKNINAKSIMGMMTFAPSEGDVVIISANGADESEAVQGIKKFLEGNK